jgi:hypothetical protein
MYSAWIAMMCVGIINATQKTACIKSLEAAGIQSGIVEKTKRIEHQAQIMAEKRVIWVSPQARFAMATIYTVGVKKQVAIPFDMAYPFQRIEFQGSTNKALLLFKWTF